MKDKNKKKLHDFIFVDNRLLDKYVEQIRDLFSEIDKKSWKMSASLTGPSIETSRTSERVPLKTHEKIDLIEAFLEADGELLHARPEEVSSQSFSEDAPRFVLESMSATKVVLPLTPADSVKGLSNVAIWFPILTRKHIPKNPTIGVALLCILRNCIGTTAVALIFFLAYRRCR